MSGHQICYIVISHECMYTLSHSVEVRAFALMDTIHALALCYNDQFLCKIYTRHLSMQTFTADYTLSYFTTRNGS